MTYERRVMLETKLGYDGLGVMEIHLKDRAFFVGDHHSIADISPYAYTHVADEVGVATEILGSDATPTSEGGVDLARFAAIRAWLERVRAQQDHTPTTQA